MPHPNERMNRRDLVKRMAATAMFLGIAPHLPAMHHVASRGKRMGVVIHSYAFRGKQSQTSKKYPPFKDALELLEHVHTYGAGGIQTRTSGWNSNLARRLRAKSESLDMFIEGSISTPKDKGDQDRFESEIKIAKEAGVTVFRTAMGGRRYEDFSSRSEWEAFRSRSEERLKLAEPIAKRQRIRLAVENHKDWQTSDLLELMATFSSEYIGVTIDTGNSISLMEHPDETVSALAPYAFSTHIKDMAVKEYDDGFLLSGVPLGYGLLKLNDILNTVGKFNPGIRFSLEMITRNPLKIPCKTDDYWATFENKDSKLLDKTLTWIGETRRIRIPSVEGMDLNESIEYEEFNNQLSIKYAEKRLNLRG